MLDDEIQSPTETTATAGRRPRRRAASRPAGPPQPAAAGVPSGADAARASEDPPRGEPAPAQTPAAEGRPDTTAAVGDAAVATATIEDVVETKAPKAKKKSAKKAATRKSGKRDATGDSSDGDSNEAAVVETPAAGVDPLTEAVAAVEGPDDDAPAGKTTRKRSSSRRAKKAAADDSAGADQGAAGTSDPLALESDSSSSSHGGAAAPEIAPSATSSDDEPSRGRGRSRRGAAASTPTVSPVALLFQAPDPATPAARNLDTGVDTQPPEAPRVREDDSEAGTDTAEAADKQGDDESGGTRRRRSRGGRNRRKSGSGPDELPAESPSRADVSDKQSETEGDDDSTDNAGQGADGGTGDESGEQSASTRRRRRRRRGGEESRGDGDDPKETVVRVREPRPKKESISSVEGSTRIEAKKQRRREGREAGRRRPPILSESEFLARRESVERVMAIRQRGETTQIAVLEDNILVEHYVALESQNSIIGNVYLGRVQNVLPSMEAAFIDIGKGRNAVLYAGEVNWALLGGSNQPRRIENALKPGQTVLVQVSKDPIGHKGARLTSQISLPGRYLVYVPAGGTSGISRKLPDTERTRLKNLLKEILPEDAGVIVRTAAEGASEEELTRDVTRLTARWDDIEKKIKSGQAPVLLYGEPDTTIKVVRDLFTEDFAKLVISGDDAWDMVDGYVKHVAPDLADRLERHEGGGDIFEEYRIEEQIAKALDRKVWLPSGGSLVIDRTEAMTVVDVNTGKFTGSGGNLEETVTKNNLEAAEEMVRQLRLRDIGGIIVIDFIDMVLEHNRDLVLRRLVECLGRDRTRHQVAEVTSLGLVQMTRKRISTGLLEAFSHTCETCQGRGVVISQDHVHTSTSEDGPPDRNGSPDRNSAGSPRPTKRSSNRRKGGGRAEPAEDTSAPAAQAPVADVVVSDEPVVDAVVVDEPVVDVVSDEPVVDAVVVADEPGVEVVHTDEPVVDAVVVDGPVVEVVHADESADPNSDDPVEPEVDPSLLNDSVSAAAVEADLADVAGGSAPDDQPADQHTEPPVGATT